MNGDERDAIRAQQQGPTQIVYVLQVFDHDWDETVALRKAGLDSQDAIEELLRLLDQDEHDAQKTYVVPGALIPARTFLLEGFYRA